ncbi:uncharacterized protein LOC129754007 [Uranotaenia lowii]|uniref:uncharacterized protein LOC129754007 n=1 Tax=Uranotaenia lowii TaxID=190385 RepID=UPI00247AD800|nr:uncharacterized protein LOC129754007 [Uranotaenia lowii]
MTFIKTFLKKFLRFDPFGDQLRDLDKLHCVIGLKLNTPRKVKLFKTTLYIMIFLWFAFAHRLYVVASKHWGFIYTVTTTMVLVAIFSASLRAYGLHRKYKYLVQLRQNLLTCSAFNRDDAEARRLRTEHFQNNQKFCLFMVCTGFVTMLIWNMTDYRWTDQYQMAFDLNFLQPRIKSALDTIFGLSLIVIAFYFWIPFITVRVLLQILRAEFMIMNKSLESVLVKPIAAAKLYGNQASGSQQAADTYHNQMFWNSLLDELKRMIEQHRLLFDMVENVRQLTSIQFLAGMGASVAISSVSVFLFMSMKGESAAVIAISSIVMLENYYNSVLVEEIEACHFATGTIIFNLEWPMVLRYEQQFCDQYRDARKILLIVLMRTRRKLHFSCGGMFEMSLVSFFQTVKTCYTILMFLLTKSEH